MPQDFIDGKLMFFEVMVWCPGTPSHYPQQMADQDLWFTTSNTEWERNSSGVDTEIPWDNSLNIIAADALLLVSPGHWQAWYGLNRINRPLSSIRNDSNKMCHLTIKKLQKLQTSFYFSSNTFSTAWVKTSRRQEVMKALGTWFIFIAFLSTFP